MKKNFHISFLTLIFFLSTTSLPVSIHLCKMADIISVEECDMCKAEREKKSCCDSDLFGSDTNIKRVNSSSACCSNQLIDATVKDNFLSAKTDTQTFSSIKFLSLVILSEEFHGHSATFFNGNDTSPPSLITNELFLLNSVLLI